MLREAKEQIENQRTAMTAALFSNPNWDQTEANRDQYIKQLNDSYNKAIAALYDPDINKEPEIDWDNPFYAAALRGMERTRKMYGGDPDTPVGELIAREITTDQYVSK